MDPLVQQCLAAFERIERSETINHKHNARFAVLVDQWRKQENLSLRELAAAIGTTKGHIGDMLRHTRPFSKEMAIKVLHQMGVK